MPLRAVFVDANPALAAVAASLLHADGIGFDIHRDPDLHPEALPALLADADIALIDHTALPEAVARRCPRLRDVVFLGTGARSYMDPEALAAMGFAVHTIKGYGDAAVAECAIGLMFTAARDFARMDRDIRAGAWRRTEGVGLGGRVLGLVGFGGIGREAARLALGLGMRVVAWNRSAKSFPGVEFLPLERLLAGSDVVSLHLALDDSTRGFLSRERLAAMKPGAILVNTARGALVDERAMIEALEAGRLRHAALDVFAVEPLPAGHPLTRLPNVTLSAHSAFRTPEAAHNLIGAALAHCRRIAERRAGDGTRR